MGGAPLAIESAGLRSPNDLAENSGRDGVPQVRVRQTHDGPEAVQGVE
jgi:hypothetical protein